LVERLIRNQQVAGSIPAGGSMILKGFAIFFRATSGLSSQIDSHTTQKRTIILSGGAAQLGAIARP
jgi:hypothetical protein